MTTATQEDSDGTGYCRGCGALIGQEHLPECDGLGFVYDIRVCAGSVIAVKIRKDSDENQP